MRGSIKLGRWWIPFRARQILAPLHGFVWAARVAGVLVGSDRYAGGAGRWSGSSSWVPAAVLPRFGVTWTATDTQHATASYRLDDTELELRYTFDDDARVKSIALDRWGDPENSGTWGVHRFMREMNRYSTFGSVTIPSAGRAAWLIGTDRWSEGDFFRYEITDYHLVTPATSKRGHESSEGVTRADLSSPRCRDLVPALGLAANAVLGPFVLDVIRYRVSDNMLNQVIGSDAANGNHRELRRPPLIARATR